MIKQDKKGIARIYKALRWRINFYYKKMTLWVKPKKTIAVYMSHPIHNVYIEDTVKLLMEKGYSIHFYIEEDQENELYQKGIQYDFLLPSCLLWRTAYPLILTAATSNRLKLRNKGSKLIHMPHSISSAHMIYPHRYFEINDVLFCCGAHHNTEFRKILKLSDKQHYLVDVGYEVIDRLMLYQGERIASDRPVVLFAPSWGGNNSLKKVGTDIIARLIKKYKIILRPHPHSRIEEKGVIQGLLKQYKNNPNFILDESENSSKSLISADLMISDYSGVAFEYALALKRPVLFLDVPRKIFNDKWNTYDLDLSVEIRYREKLGHILYDTTKVLELVDECVKEKELWGDRIKGVLPELLHNPGKCAVKAVDYIVQVLDNDYSKMEKIG